MRAGIDDPIIRKAQERLRIAAEAIHRGRYELRAVLRSLERHPDYLATERRRRKARPDECYTLAWWLHNGTHSTLYEMDIDGAPELLYADADLEQLEEGMRLHLAQEAREAKERKTRKRAA